MTDKILKHAIEANCGLVLTYCKNYANNHADSDKEEIVEQVKDIINSKPLAVWPEDVSIKKINDFNFGVTIKTSKNDQYKGYNLSLRIDHEIPFLSLRADTIDEDGVALYEALSHTIWDDDDPDDSYSPSGPVHMEHVKRFLAQNYQVQAGFLVNARTQELVYPDRVAHWILTNNAKEAK